MTETPTAAPIDPRQQIFNQMIQLIASFAGIYKDPNEQRAGALTLLEMVSETVIKATAGGDQVREQQLVSEMATHLATSLQASHKVQIQPTKLILN